MHRFLIYIVVFSLPSCAQETREIPEQPSYDGPVMEMDSVTSLFSDSAIVTIKIEALKQLDFNDGNREYPSGVYLEFYNEEGAVTSTFKSDRAYYIAEEKHYKGEGNVVVKNLESGDELNTEVLYWSPGEEKVFTDNFVTINSEGEVHTGEGLIASQNFDNYQIMKPTGTLVIEDGIE